MGKKHQSGRKRAHLARVTEAQIKNHAVKRAEGSVHILETLRAVARRAGKAAKGAAAAHLSWSSVKSVQSQLKPQKVSSKHDK
jgi:hypothetical protein